MVHHGATFMHEEFWHLFLIWKLLPFVVCLPVSHFLFIFLEKETKPQSVWNIFFALFDIVQSTEK